MALEDRPCPGLAVIASCAMGRTNLLGMPHLHAAFDSRPCSGKPVTHRKFALDQIGPGMSVPDSSCRGCHSIGRDALDLLLAPHTHPIWLRCRDVEHQRSPSLLRCWKVLIEPCLGEGLVRKSEKAPHIDWLRTGNIEIENGTPTVRSHHLYDVAV